MRQHYPLNPLGSEDAGQLPWTDGVPSTGTQGSFPGHAIVTDVEAEVLAAIDASGQTRNGSDLAQLVQAIGRGIYLGQLGGTTNALAAAIPNNVVFSSLLPGTRFTGLVTSTNTAGVTVAITGIGSPAGVQQASLLRKGGTALQAGDLPVGTPFDFRWDGAAFRMTGTVASDAGGSGSSSTLAPVVAFEAAGTYSWTATSTTIDLSVIGGGGSGGGSNTYPSGAAGGGGGRADKRITGLIIGQAYTIVVGAGGVSIAANTLANGNTGGTSSAFGVSATGGAGGLGMSGSTAVSGGAGGTGSGGDRNYAGQGGQASANATPTNYAMGGGAVGFAGGGSPAGSSSPNGTSPGAGGGGGFNASASGAGHDGAVYIWPR